MGRVCFFIDILLHTLLVALQTVKKKIQTKLQIDFVRQNLFLRKFREINFPTFEKYKKNNFYEFEKGSFFEKLGG